MIGALFTAIAAKGNGLAVGEVRGSGVVRWHVFLHVQIGWPR